MLYQIRKVTSGCHSRTDKISPRGKETTRLEINLVDFFSVDKNHRQSETSMHHDRHLDFPTLSIQPVTRPRACSVRTQSLDEARKSTKKETTSQDENEPTCSTFSSLESPVLSTLQNQNQNHIQARLAPEQIPPAMPHCSTSMIQPASF